MLQYRADGSRSSATSSNKFETMVLVRLAAFISLVPSVLGYGERRLPAARSGNLHRALTPSVFSARINLIRGISRWRARRTVALNSYVSDHRAGALLFSERRKQERFILGCQHYDSGSRKGVSVPLEIRLPQADVSRVFRECTHERLANEIRWGV